MTAGSVVIAAPLRPTAGSGNDVTAHRWADQLERLGYRVTVLAVDEHADRPDLDMTSALERADALVAIHARRSAPVIAWWSGHRPNHPLIVALSGTDLYRDMPDNTDAMASAETASALIVLQQAAKERVRRLRPGWDAKTTVIHQSVTPPLPTRHPAPGELRIVVLAHLRSVKDPFLAPRAARLLDAESLVTIHHAGRALDEAWLDTAVGEEAANPRYHWHRELDREAALRLLATGHALACTSRSEGGANVVTEAIALGVPVIGTRIEGNTGLVGDDYPGLVPVGDVEAMARLLAGLEGDPMLLADLQRRIDALRPITDPATERASLAAVLATV